MQMRLCFFIIWVLRPVKIISHFEMSKALGGPKSGDPGENPPDHPQAELGLSHMTLARLEPTGMR